MCPVTETKTETKPVTETKPETKPVTTTKQNTKAEPENKPTKETKPVTEAKPITKDYPETEPASHQADVEEKAREPEKQLLRSISSEGKNISTSNIKLQRRISFEKQDTKIESSKKIKTVDSPNKVTSIIANTSPFNKLEGDNTESIMKPISEENISQETTEIKTKLVKKKKKKTKSTPDDDVINFQEVDVEEPIANEPSEGIVEEVVSPQANINIKAFTFTQPSQLKQTDTTIEILEMEDESEGIPSMPVPMTNTTLKPVILEDKMKPLAEGEKVTLKQVRSRQKVQDNTSSLETVALKPVKKNIGSETQEKLKQLNSKETAEVPV